MIKGIFILVAIILLIAFILIPGSGLILIGLFAGGSYRKNKSPHNKLRGILRKLNNPGKSNLTREIYPRLIRFDNRLEALETILQNR